ncbi:hypothetical protein [Lactococcus petauri]|uniref:Uncharacterized protein n=1 Tax=Lactococcus petauri TaxID=1940789 RepID=A0A252CCD3_9LACT|nr:hypothetical protein [Lactococcus petauri]OUK04178.1 hypothetical protein BZZ03_06795 [Lactococcus petauri]
MRTESKRKLRSIIILALALLIGGTFAFQAFNQQAINDRSRENEVEAGGRVHDYYNDESENKDIFVENYGQNEIIARIRLSEYMEIQERGQTEFTSVVDTAQRDEVETWSTYLPYAYDINERTGEGADRFNDYSKLTFGRAGRPWYLPTFNHDITDERTAAAGDARDFIEDGATHPGDGTENDWSENDYVDNDGTWPGSMVTRETAQNLEEDRPPVTMEQWFELDDEDKIGDFWVIDQQTGWAYWASKLQGGETTSYLLDAAEMQDEADAINGAYYYAIHVASTLVTPGERNLFLEDDEQGEHHRYLQYFLDGINEGEMADGWNLPTENPPADTPSSVNNLNFGLMIPGQIFTTADGQGFRYLENMEGRNHLIIRNDAIHGVPVLTRQTRLNNWFNYEIPEDLRNIVQPVSIPSPVPRTEEGSSSFTMNWNPAYGVGFLPADFNSFPFTEAVRNDETFVDATNGSPGAFSLSLADLFRVSGTGRGFSRLEERMAGQGIGVDWPLRTPGGGAASWYVATNSGFIGQAHDNFHVATVRPALIIRQ